MQTDAAFVVYHCMFSPNDATPSVSVCLSVAALQRSETAERQSMDSGCLPSNVSEKVQWFTTDDAKHTWH